VTDRYLGRDSHKAYDGTKLMEKRPESRIPADIPLRIWGMDAEGKPFFQSALGSSLSTEGAQLTNLHHHLKTGEIVGIQYGTKKARFKVIWAKRSVAPRRNQAGVLVLAGQSVPWADITEQNRRTRPQAGDQKRRFVRYKVLFPVEIGFEDTRRAHLRSNATDIGGNGCYVEIFTPLALGSEIVVIFWLGSEKIRTRGVVRTSDPGLGMGIEFTALGDHIQQRLQDYLHKLDTGLSRAATEGS
jgi:PilZ domain